jgi:hypothetical protein
MTKFRSGCSAFLGVVIASAQDPDAPIARPTFLLPPSATVIVAEDRRAPWEDDRAVRLREAHSFLLEDLRAFRALPARDEHPNPGPPPVGPPPARTVPVNLSGFFQALVVLAVSRRAAQPPPAN